MVEENYNIYGIEFKGDFDRSIALVSNSSPEKAIGTLEKFLKNMYTYKLEIIKLVNTNFKSNKEGVIMYAPLVESWTYFTDKEGKPIQKK